MAQFFFGSPTKDLFGAYTPPPIETDRQRGVLLCYPVGQEHIRSHRAYKQIAEKLSQSGFHVLRFDYFGTGDSYGAENDCRINRWESDIITAAEELQDFGDLDNISLLGTRLGASLAVEVAEKIEGLDHLFLWDPVIKGSEYLMEIKKMHKKWSDDLIVKPPRDLIKKTEILGFGFTDNLTEDIQKIDLLKTELSSVRSIHILKSEKSECPLFSKYKNGAVGCSHSIIENARIWKKDNNMNNATTSATVVNAVVGYFLQVYK